MHKRRPPVEKHTGSGDERRLIEDKASMQLQFVPGWPTRRTGDCIPRSVPGVEDCSHGVCALGRAQPDRSCGPRAGLHCPLPPGVLQPVVAAVVGLIPSCATSVALAEGFRAGILSFPSVVSGLSANSGLGLLILVKEAENKAEVITAVALLLFAAVVAGLLGSIIFPGGYVSTG